MITQYFDINQRLIIQAPGTLAPASSTAWVYGDNYNLAIYLTAAGIIQPIGANDTLGLMLFQPAGSVPEANLAIIGTPAVLVDAAGYQYYEINVNLKTVPLADLVQTPNQSAKCQFHYTFTPADGERFSSSADLAITVNPDPTESASGATPVPPGYPTNPNVFELIANKGQPSGYAPLDANRLVPVANLPAVAAGGNMNTSVYDPTQSGTVLSAAVANAAPWAGITGKPATFPPSVHGSAHLVGGADPVALATLLAAGLCPPPDGATITISASKLVAILASATAPGIVQPDGVTVDISAGKISVPTATTGALGLVEPDGTTIAIAAGKISVATPAIGQHGARRYNSANIAVSAGSAQALTFDTSVFDSDSFYSGGRFTVPTGQAGYYAIGAGVLWGAITGLTYIMLAVRLNGAANNYLVFTQGAGMTAAGFWSNGSGQHVSGVVHLNAADYIEVIVGAAVAATVESLNTMTPYAYLLRIS